MAGMVVVALVVVALGAGQAGLLAGNPPADLGVTAGRLKAPSHTANSVSSQAGLWAGHPQQVMAAIAPLPLRGTPEEFWSQPFAANLEVIHMDVYDTRALTDEEWNAMMSWKGNSISALSNTWKRITSWRRWRKWCSARSTSSGSS